MNAFAGAPKQVGGVYGEGYLMDRQGAITRRFPATEPFNLWKLVHLSDYVLRQSAFFRRAAVEEVGWLDKRLRYAMDWDLLIRLGARFGLCYTPEYLGVLREYPEAKSFQGGRERVEEIRKVLERHTGRVAAGLLDLRPAYAAEPVASLERRATGMAVAFTAPARFLLNLVTAVPILLIQERSQGLHADGWAADRVKWMLPEGTGDVVVRGNVPADSRLTGQTLTITTGSASWVTGPWVPEPSKCVFRPRLKMVRFSLKFTLRVTSGSVSDPR